MSAAMILLFASGLLFLVPAVRLCSRAILGLPRATVSCYRCGYDLRSIAGPVCPECGAGVIAVGTRPPLRRAERAAMAILGAVLSAVVMTAAAASWDYVRLLLGGTSVTEPPGVAALRRYAAGHGSREEMQRYVAAAVAELAGSGGTTFAPAQTIDWEQRGLISIGFGTSELSALAEALDSDRISEGELDALLAAVATAYRGTAVIATGQPDDILLDLLSERRMQRFSSSSSDYMFTSAAPRTLTESQRGQLVELFLDLQRRHDRLWNSRWGEGIENAAMKGRLTNEQMSRYLSQSFSPQIVLENGDQLAAGDVSRFFVLGGWRTGSHIPVHLRVVASDPEWRGRVRVDIANGEVKYAVDNVSWVTKGWFFLPDRLGDVTVPFDVEAQFGPSVIDEITKHINPGPTSEEQRPWRALPPTTVRKQVNVTFRLVQNGAPPVAFETRGIASKFVGDQRPTRVPYWNTPEGVVVEVQPGLGVGGVGLAWDVSIRQNGEEHAVGWAFAPRLQTGTFAAIGLARGVNFDRPADLVFRSSRGLLERPIWTPIIWQGEIVQPVERFEADGGYLHRPAPAVPDPVRPTGPEPK